MQIVLALILGAVFFVLFTLLGSVPVWLLWNCLMPVIFELPKIDYLQALGLTILCAFLFKSSGFSSK